MADLLIAEDIELSRTLTASIRTLRGVSDHGWIQYRTPPDPLETEHWWASGAGGGVTFRVDTNRLWLSITQFCGIEEGFQNEPPGPTHIEAFWRSQIQLVNAGGDEPGAVWEDEYKHVHHHWEVDYYHYMEHISNQSRAPEECTYDETAEISVVISGTFKLMASYDTEKFVGHWKIWKQYGLDQNPHGMTPRDLKAWLVPTSDISVVVSVPGKLWEQTIDNTWFGSDQEAFEDYFKNGFGMTDLSSGAAGGSDLGDPCEQLETICEATLGGFPQQGEGGSHTHEEEHCTGYFNGSTGELVHTADGMAGGPYSTTATRRCGPVNKTYSGFVRPFDNTDDGPSPTTFIDETDGPDYNVTHGDIEVSGHTIHRVVHYEGWWSLDTHEDYYEHKKIFGQQGWPSSTKLNHRYACHPGTGVEGGITNLAAIGEPVFPNLEVEGEYDPDHYAAYPPNWFDDKRVEVYPSAAYWFWSDAVAYTIPASTEVYVFDSAAGWTVDPDGAAELSVVSGKLQVVVDPEAEGAVSISRTVDFYCTGYRVADLEHTSDDDDPISILLNDREWAVTGGANPAITLDLISPNTATTGADTTQHVMEGGTATWGWGVHAVTALEIGDLRAGKTYVFEHLKCRRVPANQGGFMAAYIYAPGSFIGDEAGQTRKTDPYTMFNCRCRQGIVIVDGVVAAEILGPLQIEGTLIDEGPPVLQVVATRDYPTITSMATLVPTPNHLVATVDDEGLLWRTGALENVFLEGGYYTDYDDLTIDARLSACYVQIPADLGGQTMNIGKYLQGCIAIRIVDNNGKFGVRKASIDTRHVAEGEIVETHQITTNALGWAVSPSLGQPLHNHNHIHTVHTGAGANLVEETVEVRNRNLTLLTLRAVPPAGLDYDILIDPLTGIGHCAYEEYGSVFVKRTFDAGKTWSAGIEVATGESNCRPCLFHSISGIREWGVIWTDGANVKVARSTDGFATKEIDTLMTGVSNLRGVVHPLTGIMLIAGWRDSDDSIIAAQSFDAGLTLGTPVVVVAAPEQAFGLTVAPTAMKTWCILCVNEGGEEHTYWSTDDGLHWSLAA